MSAKRIDGVRQHVATVVEIIGPETPASTIDYETAKTCRNTISALPTNRLKFYPKLDIQAAIQRAEKDGRTKISRVTQQKYLSELNNILNHGIDRGELLANRASNLQPLGIKTNPEDAKMPFDIDQLKAIFNAPLFTGCVDDEMGFVTKGDKVVRRARFWVPLICLYNGMRPNEVCQLRPKDIKQTAEENWYFDLTDTEVGQTLKTISSRRKFPVHPDLKRMGLLEYVDEKRKTGEVRLFPELKTDTYENHASKFLRWFNGTFYPKVAKKKKGQSFYSLRHNFRDELRRIQGPDELLTLLGGWSAGKTTSGNYGGGYTTDQLLEYVKKIEYPELDLSHLFVK